MKNTDYVTSHSVMLLSPKLVQIFSPASNQRASLTMGDHVHIHQRTTEIGFAEKVLTKREIIFHDSAIRRLFTGTAIFGQATGPT